MKFTYFLIALSIHYCLCTFIQNQDIIGDNIGAEFGNSVDIDEIFGGFAIIGESKFNSNQGAAYIYKHNGTNWNFFVKLTASDGVADDNFGTSVSIFDKYAIVGAPSNDYNGSSYIFEKHQNGDWVETKKLTGTGVDLFGKSVSITWNIAVVGAPLDGDQGLHSGAAYIYKKFGSNWREVQKLTALDGAPLDLFGGSVSISDEIPIVIVGAPNNDNHKGAAYIFEEQPNGVWRQEQKITALDRYSLDYFGTSVSIIWDTAIVGAPDNDNNKGAAYIFEKNVAWPPTENQKLTASDRADNDDFGWSVSISSFGQYAIVGAPNNDVNSAINSGSAYIYTYDGTTWGNEVKLTVFDCSQQAKFGTSVAMGFYTVLIGTTGYDVVGEDDSNEGGVYIFKDDFS